jgi:hypothetical protein
MSIQWIAGPPPARELPHLALVRLKTSARISGLLTCHHPQTCHMHFYAGRTLPCVGDDCPGCALQRRLIRECYVSLWTGHPTKHVILALTPRAEWHLKFETPDSHDYRGLWIDVERQGKKNNGRLELERGARTPTPHHLPPAPDIRAHLTHIWGLDPSQIGSEHPLFAARGNLFPYEPSANGQEQ